VKSPSRIQRGRMLLVSFRALFPTANGRHLIKLSTDKASHRPEHIRVYQDFEQGE